jgi:hypothetical protein
VSTAEVLCALFALQIDVIARDQLQLVAASPAGTRDRARRPGIGQAGESSEPDEDAPGPLR